MIYQQMKIRSTNMDWSDNSRREFLLQCAAASTVAAGIAAGFRPRLAHAQDDTDLVAVLGPVKDLNEKEPVLVKAQFKDSAGNIMEEEKIYVRWEKHGDSGKWVVLSAICTHLKCKIDYVADEDKFRCPCHKSEFELDGTVAKKPAKKDLPDYSADAFEEDGKLKLCRKATA
jgi:Rieske Fe-S protein